MELRLTAHGIQTAAEDTESPDLALRFTEGGDQASGAAASGSLLIQVAFGTPALLGIIVLARTDLPLDRLSPQAGSRLSGRRR